MVSAHTQFTSIEESGNYREGRTFEQNLHVTQEFVIVLNNEDYN